MQLFPIKSEKKYFGTFGCKVHSGAAEQQKAKFPCKDWGIPRTSPRQVVAGVRLAQPKLPGEVSPERFPTFEFPGKYFGNFPIKNDILNQLTCFSLDIDHFQLFSLILMCFGIPSKDSQVERFVLQKVFPIESEKKYFDTFRVIFPKRFPCNPIPEEEF